MLKRILFTLAKIAAFFLAYQVVLRIVRKNIHFPAPAFLGRVIDSGWRRMIQPPAQVIARSGFAPGMRVLEVGCGSGAYTRFVARAVGPRGEVCALDIQRGMLSQVAARLRRPENQDIHNIRLYEGSAYDLPFQDGSFDLVYLITVLQEIPDRQRALREIYRVTKPGGRLAVTEFLPDPDYPLRATTARLGREAGFAVEATPGSLWTYTVRFIKR